MTWSSHRLLLSLPILGFLVLMVMFAVYDFDLPITEPFYDHDLGMWSHEWKQPWKFLNLFGELPGLFLALGSLFVLLLSVGRPNLHPFRKITTFLLFAALLGPGIIVNGILKEHWGRPRPDSIIRFDGFWNYEPFLHFDGSSPGGSFPSGHASMGFFIMTIGLLLLAAGKKQAGRIVLLGSLVAGFVIGFSRIASGKHFASDVITAGFVIWVSTILLFFAMKMHRSLQFTPKPLHPPGFGVKLMRLASPVIIVLIIALAAVKWPLFRKYEIPVATPGLPSDAPLQVLLNVEGRVVIESAPDLHIRAITDGHGLASAKILTNTAFADQTLTVTNEKQGLFSKIYPVTHVLLPPGRSYTITLGEFTGDYDTRRFHPDKESGHTLTIVRGEEEIETQP